MKRHEKNTKGCGLDPLKELGMLMKSVNQKIGYWKWSRDQGVKKGQRMDDADNFLKNNFHKHNHLAMAKTQLISVWGSQITWSDSERGRKNSVFYRKCDFEERQWSLKTWKERSRSTGAAVFFDRHPGTWQSFHSTTSPVKAASVTRSRGRFGPEGAPHLKCRAVDVAQLLTLTDTHKYKYINKYK